MDSKVFYKNDIIYRAIPINASTYTKVKFLDMNDARLCTDMDDDFDDKTVNAFFVIVRNPIERFYSAIAEDARTQLVSDNHDLGRFNEEEKVRVLFEKIYHEVYEQQKSFKETYNTWENFGLMHMRPQNHFLYNKNDEDIRNKVTNYFRVDEGNLEPINTFLGDHGLPQFDTDSYNKMPSDKLTRAKSQIECFNVHMDPFLEWIYKDDFELLESV